MTMKNTSRREFLTGSVSFVASVSAFSFFQSACSGDANPQNKKLTIKRGKLYISLDDPAYKSLQTIGSGVKIRISSTHKPILIVRTSENEINAFASTCTHAGYDIALPQNGILSCTSGHGGSFDLQGKVLTPPPKGNLDRFNTTIQKNTLIVDLLNYL